MIRRPVISTRIRVPPPETAAGLVRRGSTTAATIAYRNLRAAQSAYDHEYWQEVLIQVAKRLSH